MVEPKTDGLMHMKVHRMCSSDYKRDLGFEFTKRPPYQLGRLDETRVSTCEGGMRNKTRNEGLQMVTA